MARQSVHECLRIIAVYKWLDSPCIQCYNAKAYIIHHVFTTHQVRSGHYVALARAPGGGWDELDDRRGAPAARTPQEVERGSADTAVLLFYARQPPPPPGWTSRGRVYHLDARRYILYGKSQ
jgi:hypothetical protein